MSIFTSAALQSAYLTFTFLCADPALPVLPFDNPDYLFQNAYEATTPCGGKNVVCCNGVGHTMMNNATKYDGYTLDYNSDGFKFFSLNAVVSSSAHSLGYDIAIIAFFQSRVASLLLH